MFRFGVSFGHNDLNLKGHLQMGYNSKTIKNYGHNDKSTVLKENTSFVTMIPQDSKTAPPESEM